MNSYKGKIPMLIYHGDKDQVLYYQLVKPGYDKHLKDLPNFNFTLIHGMGHSVVEDELTQSTAWVLKNLKDNEIVPWFMKQLNLFVCFQVKLSSELNLKGIYMSYSQLENMQLTDLSQIKAISSQMKWKSILCRKFD